MHSLGYQSGGETCQISSLDVGGQIVANQQHPGTVSDIDAVQRIVNDFDIGLAERNDSAAQNGILFGNGTGCQADFAADIAGSVVAGADQRHVQTGGMFKNRKVRIDQIRRRTTGTHIHKIGPAEFFNRQIIKPGKNAKAFRAADVEISQSQPLKCFILDFEFVVQNFAGGNDGVKNHDRHLVVV